VATKSHNNVSSWSPDRVSDYHDGRLYSDVEDEQPDCQAIQGSGHGTLSIHNRQHQARSLWGLISYMMSSHNKALSCLFDRAMNTRATGSSRQQQAAAGSGRQRQAAAGSGTARHAMAQRRQAVAGRGTAEAGRGAAAAAAIRNVSPPRFRPQLASAAARRRPQLAARSLQPAARRSPPAAAACGLQPAAGSPSPAARRYPLLPAVTRCSPMSAARSQPNTSRLWSSAGLSSKKPREISSPVDHPV